MSILFEIVQFEVSLVLRYKREANAFQTILLLLTFVITVQRNVELRSLKIFNVGWP
jgi:hypothetical protein